MQVDASHTHHDVSSWSWSSSVSTDGQSSQGFTYQHSFHVSPRRYGCRMSTAFLNAVADWAMPDPALICVCVCCV